MGETGGGAAQLLTAQWERGREYEIRDGLIRPLPGSQGEPYDPFEGFREDRNPDREYSNKVAVRRREPEAPRDAYLAASRLDENSPQQVCEFVRQWGILGIFQDRLVQLRRVFDPGRVQYEFTDPSLSVGGVYPAPGGLRSDALIRVSPPDWGRPGLAGEGEAFDVVPLGEYAAMFFPDVEPESIPSIGSDRFFAELCEPLGEFQIEVRRLRLITKLASGTDPLNVPLAWAALNQRLVRVHPAVRLTPNGLERGWSFPSLLSTFYAALYEDATGGRLRLCTNDRCQRPFIANRADARFCGRRCMDRVKQWNKRHASSPANA